jgi:hypothetical protein
VTEMASTPVLRGAARPTHSIQVADRWHLVHNLSDALERFAVRVLGLLRKELKVEKTAETAPPPEIRPPVKTVSLSQGRLLPRTEQRHAEIHELMAQGLTVSVIARPVRLDRKTVRRFAAAEVAVDLLGPRVRRATALDPYLPYLVRRWREGQHVAAFLFDEVWQEGYRGSKRTVRRQLAGWRTAEPPSSAHAMLRYFPNNCARVDYSSYRAQQTIDVITQDDGVAFGRLSLTMRASVALRDSNVAVGH